MLRARSDEAKDERRQVLMKAALDEFFEKGFSATRMADVAKRAGLSKGALYLYFDSKEALFKALIETLAAPNIEHLQTIAEQSSSLADALNGMRMFAPNMIRHSDMPRLMKVMIGDSHMFPEIVRAYRKDLLEKVLGMITGLLRRADAAGEISLQNPELTARIVIAPILLSSIWQALFGHDPDAHVDLDELFSIHGDLMLRALKSGELS